MFNERYAIIAENTIAVIKRGSYKIDGKTIDISDSVKYCYDGTKLYFNDEDHFMNRVNSNAFNRYNDTSISFTGETTMAASDRLSYEDAKVAILNFASATRPGGGFIVGANAQEETIARTSGLVHSLKKFEYEFYSAHAKSKDPYYSNRIIYSPSVPIIKDEKGCLLSAPYCVDIITSPAVNKKRAVEMKCCNNKKVYAIMLERIRQIVCIAALNGNDTLILGAFGCGAFGNDVNEVAGIFARILVCEGYMNFFKNIVFAIYDRKGEDAVRKFKKAFDAVACKGGAR